VRPGCDVLVAGAGPAGSRAAELLAAAGASVLLFDPRAPWEKPCGGGLTAAALRNTPTLEELGAESHRVREFLLVGPGGARVAVTLSSPFVVVSRHSLSRWGLARALAAGARVRRRAVGRVARRGAGWAVTDSAGEVHRARWLVVADGAASGLRRQVAPRFRPGLAPTRVTYPPRGGPAGRAAFVLLSGIGGYIWDFPRRDHHSIGIGVARGTRGRSALDAAIESFRAVELGDRTPAPHLGAVIGTSRWERGGFQDLGAREYALLGDAAGLADPATGEGIDQALRSAHLAAATFDPEHGFAAYPASLRRAFAAEMRRARLVRWWLYRPRFADWFFHGAETRGGAAPLLDALADAVNEHGSLRQAVLRGLFARGAAGVPRRTARRAPQPSWRESRSTVAEGGRPR
jgi:flavin-dependent dehydrogenase